jgi:hypothetical protein
MNNRTLGAIGIICAPALLAEILIDPQAKQPVVVGVASMIFMLGSLASHVGLWRIAATGRRWYNRVPLAIQLVLVVMAFLFGFIEATGILAEDNPLFMATDIAWPLSMVWMNIVGIATLVARRLPMPQRLVPLLCGTSLPITMLVTVAAGVAIIEQSSGYIFFSMLATFWALLGFVVMQSERVREPQVTAQPRLA